MTVDHSAFAATLRKMKRELETLNPAAELIGTDTLKALNRAIGAVEDTMISARVDKARR